MLKVKSEKLLIIAAAVWLLAGINILRLGVYLLSRRPNLLLPCSLLGLSSRSSCSI